MKTNDFEINENFRIVFISRSVFTLPEFGFRFEIINVNGNAKDSQSETKGVIKESKTVLNAKLVEAGFNGELEEIKLLISLGADVMAKDLEGDTCFSEACLLGHQQIVHFFLNMKIILDNINI